MGGSLPASSDVALIILGLTVAALVLMHLMDLFVLKKAHKLESKPWLLWIVLIIGQALCLLVGEPSNEFIYFQF